MPGSSAVAPFDGVSPLRIEEEVSQLQLLLIDGLGPARMRRLWEKFSTAREILAATDADLSKVRGIERDMIVGMRSAALKEKAQEQWQKMRQLDGSLRFARDDDFPGSLREIPSAPVALTLRGTWTKQDQRAIAIVGSRRCSSYGVKMATTLAGDLARRGFTVVSGLARGIDAAAHQAALDAGGRTLAVLASGINNIYPKEHAALALAVAQAGAVISEAGLDGPPIGELFPQRNRIISGLSLGVVVVEASDKSGTLSTANHALEQGREVFAVPGRVGDPASVGTNKLLKDGACLVRDVDDILESLAVSPGLVRSTNADPTASEEIPEPRPTINLESLSPTERKIVAFLGTEEVELESLVDRTGISVAEASASLFMLEMKKVVRRLPGNRYARR